MEQFNVFFQVGISHITDIRGYDHILFIIALCAIYFPKDLKRLLILITAFTIGHSITLALATFNVVRIDGNLVEFLIPVTIVLTSLLNFRNSQQITNAVAKTRYIIAMLFGLVHGLGFSNYLRSLLLKSQSLAMPLFAFNLGLEVGQILIVLVLLALCVIFVNVLRTKERDWTIFLSGISFGIAVSIIIEKLIN